MLLPLDLLLLFLPYLYILDTLRGKTHPNIVTWFTWTLINTITAIAAWSGGARQTAIFAGATAICTAAVVVVGLRHGIKKYTLFDIACQALAITGMVLWRLTREPSVAIAINIFTDSIGMLPTYRHSLRSLKAETWQAYAIGGFSALLAIASIKAYNFVSFGYPLYILLSNVLQVWVILYRRQQKDIAT